MNDLIKYAIILYKKSLIPKISLYLTEIKLYDFLKIWEQKLVSSFTIKRVFY